MIALLLSASVIVYGVIAYSAARASALHAATDRLDGIVTHVADLLANQVEDRHERVAAAAAEPMVEAFMMQPGDQALGPARSAVLSHLPRSQRSVFEIRDAHGVPLALISGEGGQMASGELVHKTSYRVAGVGPLVRQDETILMEYGAPIMVDENNVGSLAELRQFAVPTANATAITSFIGTNSGIFIGNLDGSLWTDLAGNSATIPGPSGDLLFERDGEMRIGRVAPIANTMLLAAVDVPAETILGPVDRMAIPLVLIALLVIASGALVGWMLSRGITGPLGQLTAASHAVSHADGKFAHSAKEQLPTDRDDEIGALANAFTIMAARVEASREELEKTVDKRTAQLRKTLRRLQDTQKELIAKERFAVMGQLSGSIGHELRNPLGVINNAVYLLESAVERSPGKAREYVELIRTQIELSERIVSDLLGFTGVKAPHRGEISLDTVIREQLARLTVPAHVRVDFDLAPDLPLVNVDRLQIGQVVLNLTSNAMQAMENEARECILTYRGRLEEQSVRLDVVDTGRGIKQEHLPRVFEPLFTTRARGIGLGLALSRSLAEANGGSLTVSSEYGFGATFTLIIPAVHT